MGTEANIGDAVAMTRPKLVALGRRLPEPQDHRCSCGCGLWGSFGFPGGRWFACGHVPPELLSQGPVLPSASPEDEAGAPQDEGQANMFTLAAASARERCPQ